MVPESDRPTPMDAATALLVRRDQAASLWRSQYISLPANLILAFSTILTLWTQGLERSLTIWFGLLVIFVIFGLVTAKSFQARGMIEGDPQRFMRFSLGSALVRGLIWSALPFIASYEQTTIVLFVISGLCAGATALGTAFANWPIIFVTPVLAGSVFQLLRHSGFESDVLAVNIVYFFILLTRSARNGEKIFLEASRLKHEATALAGRLRDAHLDAVASAERLYHLASHDDLTGLANRAAFVKAMEARVTRTTSPGRHFHLLLLDLDAFKSINDTLGHGAGDAVLVACAKEIRQCLRAQDLPARLGGDEFAVLIAGASDDEVKIMAERIIERVEGCRPPGDETSRFGISIGAARYPRDASSSQDLMIRTDLALYAAKRGGRRRFCGFDHSLVAFAEAMRHTGSGAERSLGGADRTAFPSPDPAQVLLEPATAVILRKSA